MMEPTDSPVVDRDAKDRSPERTCIVTRAVLPPAQMLRFVLDPSGEVAPDVAGRLPGRGAWVVAERAIVDRAVAGKHFQKAFKRQVKVRPDLGEWVDGLLERRALERLSLANKAGLVVAGFTRVESLLASGKVAVLIHARDGAPDGIGKLDRLYQAVCAELGRTPSIHFAFQSQQLGLALGRSNVIHAALESGGAAASFVQDLARLMTYRKAAASDLASSTPPEKSGASKG